MKTYKVVDCASVGFCTDAPVFSKIGHYKVLPANESWMYLSTGKLVGGNLSIDVTPWGQPMPSGPSVEVPRANLSASLTRRASGEADVASYSADFFLNGELVGSLSVQLPAGAGDAAAALRRPAAQTPPFWRWLSAECTCLAGVPSV